MRIILLQDVKNLGKKGQKIVVSDGYGANFLIPKKLAVLDTPQTNAQFEREKENERLSNEKIKLEALETAKKLEKVTVTFEVPAGKEGKIFGSISPKQIEDELKNRYGIIIDKRKFIDKYAINTLGYSRLNIELCKDVTAIITILVKEKV